MRIGVKWLAVAGTVAIPATGAVAGGVGPTVVEPAPVASPAQRASFDWTGFYAGLSLGGVSTTGRASPPPIKFTFSGGFAPGVFAGYNWQSGQFVYGGELAFSFPSRAHVTAIGGAPVPKTGHGVQNVFDIFARGGYAVDRALFYGKIGYSRASYDPGVVPRANYDGLALGLGFEYAVRDNVLLGVDLTTRDLRGTGGFIPPGVTMKMRPTTVAVRIAYKF